VAAWLGGKLAKSLWKSHEASVWTLGSFKRIEAPRNDWLHMPQLPTFNSTWKRQA